MTGKGALGSGIVALTMVLGFLYAHHQYAKAKAEAKDVSLCINDGNRVKIPNGYYRDSQGGCVKQKTAEEQAAEKEKAAQEYAAAHPPEDPEYPRKGAGYATKATPLGASIDPQKSFVRPSQSARYVVADHPTMYIDDHMDRRDDKKWWTMPKGRYLIYSLGEDEIYVRWWQ